MPKDPSVLQVLHLRRSKTGYFFGLLQYFYTALCLRFPEGTLFPGLDSWRNEMGVKKEMDHSPYFKVAQDCIDKLCLAAVLCSYLRN